MSNSVVQGIVETNNYVWDVGTLSWVPEQQPIISGTITIGTVDQGTGGASAWLVTVGNTSPIRITGVVIAL